MSTKKRGRAIDICAIIEVCAKAQVHTFRWGNIRIDFTSPEPRPAIYGVPTTARMEQSEQEALGQSELSSKEDEISLLQITDPLRYEEMIAEGELVDQPVGDSVGKA